MRSLTASLYVHLVVAAAIVGCTPPKPGMDRNCGSGDVGKTQMEAGCNMEFAAIKICDGVVRDTASDNQNCGACGNACPRGQLCFSGMCRPVDQGCTAEKPNKCGEVCTDLQTDDRNCGACGQACVFGSGQTCVAGRCACAQNPPEAPTLTACGEQCLDLGQDPENCGRCGLTCPKEREFCVDSQCKADPFPRDRK